MASRPGTHTTGHRPPRRAASSTPVMPITAHSAAPLQRAPMRRRAVRLRIPPTTAAVPAAPAAPALRCRVQRARWPASTWPRRSFARRTAASPASSAAGSSARPEPSAHTAPAPRSWGEGSAAWQTPATLHPIGCTEDSMVPHTAHPCTGHVARAVWQPWPRLPAVLWAMALTAAAAPAVAQTTRPAPRPVPLDPPRGAGPGPPGRPLRRAAVGAQLGAGVVPPLRRGAGRILARGQRNRHAHRRLARLHARSEPARGAGQFSRPTQAPRPAVEMRAVT